MGWERKEVEDTSVGWANEDKNANKQKHRRQLTTRVPFKFELPRNVSTP